MIDAFFAYARERYRIRLKRNAGESKPWTDDPILAQYSFTEVFREDDKTTRWLRENVRDTFIIVCAMEANRWCGLADALPVAVRDRASER